MISEECSDTVVGLDMLVGLSTGLRCSLKRSLSRLLVSPIRFFLLHFLRSLLVTIIALETGLVWAQAKRAKC